MSYYLYLLNEMDGQNVLFIPQPMHCIFYPAQWSCEWLPNGRESPRQRKLESGIVISSIHQ